MAENYKHLYEQAKKMLTMYQDELIPGFRKQIEELEAELAEREKAVIQLRKQWQDAEMHICTMCGHFDHKTDGNIVYGNKNCGEIVGYPYCAEKFTPWIPVTERLPEKGVDVLVFNGSYYFVAQYYTWHIGSIGIDRWSMPQFAADPTHWMPLPEAPKENDNG